MRRPSLVVPAGALVAAVGITLPVVRVGVRVPDAAVPVASDLLSQLVEAIPDQGLGASTDQRRYLLGMLAIAVTAWLLPLLVPRLTGVGVGLAVAAAAITAVAACRGWIIEIRGPGAVADGDSSFLERTALTVLDKLHSAGVLVIHPGPGLWLLSAGALVLVAGALLALRPARSG